MYELIHRETELIEVGWGMIEIDSYPALSGELLRRGEGNHLELPMRNLKSGMSTSTIRWDGLNITSLCRERFKQTTRNVQESPTANTVLWLPLWLVIRLTVIQANNKHKSVECIQHMQPGSRTILRRNIGAALYDIYTYCNWWQCRVINCRAIASYRRMVET